MEVNVERIIQGIQHLSAEDITVVEDIVSHYLSCTDEMKELMHNSNDDTLKRMVSAGFLTKRLLGPRCRAIVTDTKNGLLASDPEDYGVGWDLRRDGGFGLMQLQTLSEILQPSSKVLIVGAHIGSLAIPLSGICAEVTAIEANPHTFDLLEMNLRLNKVSNCKLFNVAASDKNEPITFMLSRANSGGSKRKPLNDQYIYNYDHPEELQVPGVRLDDFFEQHDFDLVLMDIEGSEYYALKGMPRILQQTKTLVLEFTPHHFRNISGSTMDDLLALLPEFATLSIPSQGKTIQASQFSSVLNYMYENDIEDDGIIFRK